MELVERLRKLQKLVEGCNDDVACSDCENWDFCSECKNEMLVETYKEAADVIESLQSELQSARVEANNYRKALEALDGVKK